MTERVRVLLLVLLTVGLNAFSAVILKEAADMERASIFILMILILVVVVVNFLRVRVWGTIHKRYRLSDSYPLTSLFFPLILLLGVYYGDEVRLPEIFGAALITAGVFLLSYDSEGISKSMSQDR
tara:strand:+ start:4388 stop:4762 length:375 start_codon:yes stop_codon:yes gene_type:complete